MKVKAKQEKIYFLVSGASVFLFFTIWYICIDVLKLDSRGVFPGPVTVFNAFIKKLYTKAPDGGLLLTHLVSSLKMAFLGYSLGIVFGVPLGIVMAWNKWCDRLLRPLFDLLKPIPGIAWIPVFLIVFGIGVMSKALVIFLSALIICIVNTYTGIKMTSELHLWVGNVFGATAGQKLWRIAIPTALPMIFTGLRVALGASWASLVAAELLASTNGLGYMIQQSRSFSRPDIVIVGMLTIGVVGAVFDKVLRIVEIRVAKGMNLE